MQLINFNLDWLIPLQENLKNIKKEVSKKHKKLFELKKEIGKKNLDCSPLSKDIKENIIINSRSILLKALTMQKSKKKWLFK